MKSSILLLIQGCEPEVVELGSIDNTSLVFVGIERPGMIAVYVVNEENTDDIRMDFQSIYFSGGSNKTWEELYEERAVHALDVEDLV